jgi:hypothetical protein
MTGHSVNHPGGRVNVFRDGSRGHSITDHSVNNAAGCVFSGRDWLISSGNLIFFIYAGRIFGWGWSRDCHSSIITIHSAISVTSGGISAHRTHGAGRGGYWDVNACVRSTFNRGG